MYPARKSSHHDLYHWYPFPKTPTTLQHQTPLAPPVTSAAARAGIWPDIAYFLNPQWQRLLKQLFCKQLLLNTIASCAKAEAQHQFSKLSGAVRQFTVLCHNLPQTLHLTIFFIAWLAWKHSCVFAKGLFITARAPDTLMGLGSPAYSILLLVTLGEMSWNLNAGMARASTSSIPLRPLNLHILLIQIRIFLKISKPCLKGLQTSLVPQHRPHLTPTEPWRPILDENEVRHVVSDLVRASLMHRLDPFGFIPKGCAHLFTKSKHCAHTFEGWCSTVCAVLVTHYWSSTEAENS